jgi:hypothetical protein
MSINTFLARHSAVSAAQHGSQCVYVGRDQSQKWWVLHEGKIDPIEADISEEAQAAAHQLIDGDQPCTLQLEWKLIPATKADHLEDSGHDSL